jgi:HEAT repeat protein
MNQHARLLLLLLPFVVGSGRSLDWLKQVQDLPFGQRLLEIKAVSTLPAETQKDRVPALIQLLKDRDQSIRVTAAAEIAELRAVSEAALPALVDKFDEPHGEEGAEYVAAVAAFGDRALPLLQEALRSNDWLVRSRVCDTIRTIKPSLYRDGECKERAP